MCVKDVATAAAVVLGGTIASGVTSSVLSPKPPSLPEVSGPQPTSPTTADAVDADVQERQRRAGAVGRSETVMSRFTPTEVAVDTTVRKTALGA